MEAIRIETKRLEVNDLTLEITRRCNMSCEHCLRGSAQPKDMPYELIDNVFARVGRIRTLTFTGGEPSLRPAAMIEALRACQRYDVDVAQVYIVTNGKTITEKFLDACRRWHMYCIERQAVPWKYVDCDHANRVLNYAAQSDERDCGCWVALSMDRFHDPIRSENLLKLLTLPHLVRDKYHAPDDDHWIFDKGRAATNGIGVIQMDRRPWLYDARSRQLDMDESQSGWSVEELYVNADGLLTKDCDYPYREQREHAVGHIDAHGKDHAWLDRLAQEHNEA